MSDAFCFERNDTEDTCRIVLKGIIDEDALLQEAFKDLRGSIEIDMRGIVRINSCGIRTWVNLITDISSKHQVSFLDCPPVIVRQFNMISNFGGKGTVKSFRLPYYCAACDKEHDIETDAENYVSEHPALDVPKRACPTCGDDLEFDDIEEKYLHFLKQQ